MIIFLPPADTDVLAPTKPDMMNEKYDEKAVGDGHLARVSREHGHCGEALHSMKIARHIYTSLPHSLMTTNIGVASPSVARHLGTAVSVAVQPSSYRGRRQMW